MGDRLSPERIAARRDVALEWLAYNGDYSEEAIEACATVNALPALLAERERLREERDAAETAAHQQFMDVGANAAIAERLREALRRGGGGDVSERFTDRLNADSPNRWVDPGCRYCKPGAPCLTHDRRPKTLAQNRVLFGPVFGYEPTAEDRREAAFPWEASS